MSRTMDDVTILESIAPSARGEEGSRSRLSQSVRTLKKGAWHACTHVPRCNGTVCGGREWVVMSIIVLSVSEIKIIQEEKKKHKENGITEG